MCLVGSCAGEVKDFGRDLPAYQAHLTMAGRETAHCGGFVWTSQQSGSNAAKSSLPKCGRQARSPRLSPVCSEAGHRRPGAAGASLHFTLLMGERGIFFVLQICHWAIDAADDLDKWAMLATHRLAR